MGISVEECLKSHASYIETIALDRPCGGIEYDSIRMSGFVNSNAVRVFNARAGS
jgi:hypothetical protein